MILQQQRAVKYRHGQHPDMNDSTGIICSRLITVLQCGQKASGRATLIMLDYIVVCMVKLLAQEQQQSFD